jgi:hypothetical protein
MTTEPAVRFPDPALQRLYERALGDPWCVQKVMTWDPHALARLPAATRHAMRSMYTDVAFAEALGARLLQGVVERAPEGYLRAFARAQLRDELRHVRFFSAVLQQLGEPEAASPALFALADEIAAVRDADELMVQQGRVLAAKQRGELAEPEEPAVFFDPRQAAPLGRPGVSGRPARGAHPASDKARRAGGAAPGSARSGSPDAHSCE